MNLVRLPPPLVRHEFRNLTLFASQLFDTHSCCRLQNREITEPLTRALESSVPSVQSIETISAHPVYTAFQKQWQIHAYFWKEIVVKFEEALAPTTRDSVKGMLPPIGTWPESSSHPGSAPFTTNQAVVVWNTIFACWSSEVCVPMLSYQFC